MDGWEDNGFGGGWEKLWVGLEIEYFFGKPRGLQGSYMFFWKTSTKLWMTKLENHFLDMKTILLDLTMKAVTIDC